MLDDTICAMVEVFFAYLSFDFPWKDTNFDSLFGIYFAHFLSLLVQIFLTNLFSSPFLFIFISDAHEIDDNSKTTALTSLDLVESQSSIEMAVETLRSSVTRVEPEIRSAAVKFATVTGNAQSARTAILHREMSADDATQTRMEHPGRRRSLNSAKETGIAQCVTTTTSHGEQSANGVMQTKTEHLELRAGVMVREEGVEVDSEEGVDHSVQGVEEDRAAVAVQVDVAEEGLEIEEEEEERLVAVVVDSTNHSVMRPRARKSRLTK